jgi:hypothetical protein
MKKLFLSLIAVFSGYLSVSAQTVADTDGFGNPVNTDNQNNTFNPNRKDSTHKSKIIPKGIYVWRVDRKLGDIIKDDVDTIPHLYPQSTMGMGTHGAYNTTGSNYTARLSRIFIDRQETDQFIFTQPYSQVMKTPDQWHFTNTLSPITNLSYDNCGDKTDGEDHLDARFAVNLNKKFGLGFDVDYDYARGYFQNQNISHINTSLYASYIGGKYQMHVLYKQHYQKATENGGITNDDYITHPDLFSESYKDNEIPVVLASNWNRNISQHLFLTHRYNLGFYRDVMMTEEEIEAKKFAEKSRKEAEQRKAPEKEEPVSGRPDNAKPVEVPQGRPEGATIAGDEPTKPIIQKDSIPTDTTRIKVDSKQMSDSLLAAEALKDSLAMYMKKEFVPVTSFIHTFDFSNYERIYQSYRTPTGYYANTYYPYTENIGYPGDSVRDETKHMMVKNTFGIALLEGFNKWAKAGLKGFITHEFRRFDMPALNDAGIAVMDRWTEQNISVGGRLSKTQGKTLHYDLTAETWLVGKDLGQLKVDFSTDLNFALWGDTVRLAAKGYLHRLNPTFYERNFHSKHFWWDQSLSKTTRLRLEGLFAYEKTNTKLRVAIEELQNYTYFGMSYTNTGTSRTGLSATIHQSSAILHVFTAQLDQKLSLGPVHWDNVLTYQTSSDPYILPLPALNIFSNLYLKFVYAKVLSVELGGAATFFTNYYAPDFVPQLNQFAVQENADSKVEIGNFPIIDVYANLHLKHARFFVMMTNIAGDSFNKKAFLTPHYPLNRSVLKMGVSWNFFN